MAEEHQITIQIEEPQTPAEPANNPTPLHFGEKCEAIVVQEDGYPCNGVVSGKAEHGTMRWTEHNVQKATILKEWLASL